MQKLLEEGNLEKINEKVNSEEFLNLPYFEKNALFMTSHKLKDFDECAYGYYLKWIRKVKSSIPTTSEALVIGQCFDDLVASEEKFYQKYEVMDRRVEDPELEIALAEAKITEAQKMLNKNGTRSAKGIKQEEQAIEKIEKLKKLTGKIQITNDMFYKVAAMLAEFRQNPCFKQDIKKAVFVTKFGGFWLKAELDNLDVKNKMIIDQKTTQSILTFDPLDYEWQMCFYQFVIEEVTGERYGARLEVTDKSKYVSRSCAYEFSPETLARRRGYFVNLLSKMKECELTGIYPITENQEVLFRSPYYGFEGYGRPTKPIQL